jgi:hypothetical protein
MDLLVFVLGAALIVVAFIADAAPRPKSIQTAVELEAIDSPSSRHAMI